MSEKENIAALAALAVLDLAPVTTFSGSRSMVTGFLVDFACPLRLPDAPDFLLVLFGLAVIFGKSRIFTVLHQIPVAHITLRQFILVTAGNQNIGRTATIH